MSSQTTTITTAGHSTYTAPSTLLNGTVTATVNGSPGATAPGNATRNSGNGGQVVGTIAISPSALLNIYVGDDAGNGYHAGGVAGTQFNAAGNGGGSSAVANAGGTVLLEGGGGGGGGGADWAGNKGGGIGGSGGQTNTAGGGGASDNPGSPFVINNGGGGGQPNGTGGLGGTGNTNGAAGSNQSAGVGGAGGTGAVNGPSGAGGGGGGGHQGGGGGGQGASGPGTADSGAGGGAGAGGTSYADVSVTAVSYGDGAVTNYGSVTLVATVADPPNTPTPTGPANNTYSDTEANGAIFTWTYQPGTDSGTQSGYCLRFQMDGGAYQYWNATTHALQSTQVWNTSVSSSASIPAGILTDDHVWTWSVATEESHYNLQGPFSAASTLNSVIVPTVSATSVSVSTGPDITVHFHYSATESAQMQQVEVQIYGADGTTLYYDSGWVAQTLASGSDGTFIVDAVTAGIPTDTGTPGHQSLIAKVSASPTAPPTSPLVTHSWAQGTSASFDIQWGIPSASWVLEPPNLVITSEVQLSWHMSDSRSNPQGSYQVKLLSSDGSILYYDTGLTGGTFSGPFPGNGLPFALVNGTSYEVEVLTWNSNGVPAPPLTTTFVSGQSVPPSIPTGGPLRRLLAMLAFQLDINRTLLENLRYANDPMRCPGNLLPLLCQQLGLSYEESMGMAQVRKLLSDIVHEYKEKGTYNGIAGISTAVTGWGAQVNTGPNLVPPGLYFQPTETGISKPTFINDTNPADATYGKPIQSGSIYTGANAPTAWASATSFPANTPIRTIGAGYNGTTYTGNVVFNNIGAGNALASGQLIPIPPGTSPLSASIWLWIGAITSPPAFNLMLRFYDRFGNVLSTSAGGNVATSTNAWTELTVANVAVPSAAAYCLMQASSAATLTINSVNHLILAALPSLTASTTASTWTASTQRPTDLQIILDADRINLVQNPSFESNTTTYWTPTNCTAAPTNTVAYQPPGAATPGTHSCQVTASASGGTISLTSSLMPIEAVELYTATAYVYAAATARQVFETLLIYDAQGNLLDTINGPTYYEGDGTAGPGVAAQWSRIVAQVDPQPSGTIQEAIAGDSSISSIGPLATPTRATIYPNDQIVLNDNNGNTQTFVCSTLTAAGATSIPVESATVRDSGFPYGSSWVDMTPLPPLPANATQAAVKITWLACAPNEVHNLDCVMLEQGWAVNDYFDASLMNGSSHSADYFWETPGPPAYGPSFYYRNYTSKVTRLAAVLGANPNPDNTPVGQRSPLSLTGFVPAGTTFSLITPQTPVP